MKANLEAVQLSVSFRSLSAIVLFILTCSYSLSSLCKAFDSTSQKEVSAVVQPFPIGMFEDGNILNGNEKKFRTMIADLQSRGLNAFMLNNNNFRRDTALLDVSDELGFSVYMQPNGDLNKTWWPSDIPATRTNALKAARPIVNQWKSHPSLKGYVIKDEPILKDLKKVELINHAFQGLDANRPVMPILIGASRIGPFFIAAQPNVMLIDAYPTGARNELCDFTMTGFGYKTMDFVSYIRVATKNKPPSTPLWVILQTHNFLDQLRQPTQAEVREQYWLAIGEGAKGIFWFIYSSQQGWKGLVDNPTLYDEVTDLARRTIPLRDVLQNLQKAEDQFSISGSGRPPAYISTLKSDDNRTYVVAVNKDCRKAQKLTIEATTSTALQGQLKDLETSHTYKMGESIPFPAGDGKIFELVTKDKEKKNESFNGQQNGRCSAAH